jgi:hypothetical protein
MTITSKDTGKTIKDYEAILTIVADELGMPHDSSLSDILACLYFVDVDGEIMTMLRTAIRDEVIARIQADIAKEAC